jgi:hypothetical protein
MGRRCSALSHDARRGLAGYREPDGGQLERARRNLDEKMLGLLWLADRLPENQDMPATIVEPFWHISRDRALRFQV